MKKIILTIDSKMDREHALSFDFESRIDFNKYYCISTIGSEAELIHDILDEIIVGDGITQKYRQDILTTWHNSKKDFDEYIKALDAAKNNCTIETLNI